jgi:hypothetical protein
MRRPRAGLIAFAIFFAIGAAMSGLAAFLLAVPGTSLDTFWNANPRARFELERIGAWGVVLMASVSLACMLAGVGIWKRARWGHRLAVALIAVSMSGDIVNAIVHSDAQPLIGVPIALAMLAYLLSRRVRAEFAARTME